MCRNLIIVAMIWTTMCIVGGEKSPTDQIHQFLTKAEVKQLFNVESHTDVPEYEIIFIRKRRKYPEFGQGRNKRGMWTEPFWLKGKGFDMELKPNVHLISPSLKIIKLSSDGKEEMEPPRDLCHYIGLNDEGAAALSNCGAMDPAEMSGVILLPDKVLSVKPIPRRMRIQLRSRRKERETEEDDTAHVMYKDSKASQFAEGCKGRNIRMPRTSESGHLSQEDRNTTRIHSRQVTWNLHSLYLELGVFVDAACNKRFTRYYSDKEFHELILGYVNQIQAVYYQPLMKRRLHISLVRLEIQKEQPEGLRTFGGKGSEYLDEFCQYQFNKNSQSDSDPGHWDLALLLTGLDLYVIDHKTSQSSDLLGIANSAGICNNTVSCVVGEFGTIGKYYSLPVSSGLSSAYIAAHEMAHSLGMRHDGPPFNPECESWGFIMSSEGNSTGCTTWSNCSAAFMLRVSKGCLLDPPGLLKELEEDHLRYKLIPGQTWDANEQCRLFLRDDEASVYNRTLLKNVCNEIICISPNFPGYYSAGPAIDGTYCGGDNMWCQYGRCVKADKKLQKVPGGWSGGGYFNREGFKCESGCISNSVGVARLTRRCDSPKPKNTEGCDGYREGYHLCDDSALCKERINVITYANQRCQEFSKYVANITSKGKQALHSYEDLAQSCRIYCKSKNGRWTARFNELQELGINAFFPDGTLCHTTAFEEKYYCRVKMCTEKDIHFNRK